MGFLRRPSLLITAAIMSAITSTPVYTSPALAKPAAEQAPPPLLLWDAVTELPAATESRDGYKRTSFHKTPSARLWIDLDHDGCDTRREVLIAEAVTAPEIGQKCTLTGGIWRSYYDGITVDSADKLDIDHVVPLAEAWDSGASAWTVERRVAYANDLNAEHHLVAVTQRSNRQKADRDPAEWLPPDEPVRCRYVAEWTAIKRRWQLTVDDREKETLEAIARGCPNVPLDEQPTP
ncbi:hypothetical protein HD597_006768 [Nonomuraea thailandensis]|uniref:GmrSD restriction endonucleases C-terminal domain-containing protein n=1 Tax=Nonomuraea thailandensis TaxID=1188745 RepID=A0A9X2GRV8_9ACTN|nr:HNH endonuclease family protein [Nonomuraea thailandensis]MCP2359748.1 hypothetical protein [Nonomuraea thailandensis]